MSVFALILTAALGAGVDFEASVLPVLEEKCFRCHRATYRDEDGRLRRPKGGLRLDGRSWLEHGVDGDPVVIPGDAAESSLWALTVLPEDDGDRMPKSGDPLTAREIEVLKRWIEGGADFGDWVGVPRESEGPAPEPTPATGRFAPLVALGAGVSPAPARTVEALTNAGARVEAIFPGSPLLRVSFPADGERIDDEISSALNGVQGHVTVLDLSRTSIGDGVLRTVGRFSRLTRLDLRGTSVTDTGLTQLRGLSELRTLNLFGTKVTDRGLDSIAKLAALESIHVGETGITKSALEKLGSERPKLRVAGDPEFGER